MKIADLKLSKKTHDVLKRAGIATVDDLSVYSHSDMLRVEGVGPSMVEEIERALMQAEGKHLYMVASSAMTAQERTDLIAALTRITEVSPRGELREIAEQKLKAIITSIRA